MSTFRERYFKDFIATHEPCNNKKGFRIHYFYAGDWYTWSLRPKRVRVLKWVLPVLQAASGYTLAQGSLRDCPANAERLTGALSLIAVSAWFFALSGVLWFAFSKKRMMRSDSKTIVCLLLGGSGVMAVAMFAAAISAAAVDDAMSMLSSAFYSASSVMSTAAFFMARHLRPIRLEVDA